MKYKWSVIASFINALLIGVLWSVSISTIYPVLEISFSEQTFPEWVDQQISKHEREMSESQLELDRYSERQRSNPSDQQAAEIVDSTRIQILENEKSIVFYKSLDRNVTPLLPESAFGTLSLMMLVLVVLTSLKGFCVIAQAVLVSRISQGTVRDLRRIFFRSILQMDQLKVDKMGGSRLMTMLSHNINLVGSGLDALYCQSLREPLKMLACLVGAAMISWQLLLISMVVAPLGYLALRKMKYLVTHAAREHMGGIAVILKTLSEIVLCLKIVKIFNRERTEMKRFKDNASSLYGLANRMNFYDAILNPLTETLGIVGLAITILCGGWLVMNGETHLLGLRISDRPLTPSLLFLFFGLLAGVSGPARKLSGVYNRVIRACMASEALYNTFDLTRSQSSSENQKESIVTVPTLTKEIRLDDVIFTYGIMKRVLKHVSLTIPYGQTVAFVGHNGCGKSTLVHLIARFYDPTEGDIYFDDVNIKKYHPRNLRRQISMVTQDAFLFNGTVEENIAYGNPSASQEKIREAAEMAMVTDFIDRLPNGWNTQIGEGGNRLSGGQKQRIAFARAIVADPTILILDEATSQIDPAAEAKLHKKLRGFLKERTVLMITHRTTSLQLADRVVVMDSGWIMKDLPRKKYLKDLPAVMRNQDGEIAA